MPPLGENRQEGTKKITAAPDACFGRSHDKGAFHRSVFVLLWGLSEGALCAGLSNRAAIETIAENRQVVKLPKLDGR
jgi:hypothetical protein